MSNTAGVSNPMSTGSEVVSVAGVRELNIATNNTAIYIDCNFVIMRRKMAFELQKRKESKSD